MVEVTSGNGALRLRVSNDGAPDCRAAGTEPGSGLANLTARVHAAGGQLTSRQAAGGFDLVAEIPVAATPS